MEGLSDTHVRASPSKIIESYAHELIYDFVCVALIKKDKRMIDGSRRQLSRAS